MVVPINYICKIIYTVLYLLVSYFFQTVLCVCDGSEVQASGESKLGVLCDNVHRGRHLFQIRKGNIRTNSGNLHGNLGHHDCKLIFINENFTVLHYYYLYLARYKMTILKMKIFSCSLPFPVSIYPLFTQNRNGPMR